MATADNMIRASHFLGEWINSAGRFDLNDVADRAGVLPEVEFLKDEIYELLYDDLNAIELAEVFEERRAQAVDQTEDLFSRFLALFR